MLNLLSVFNFNMDKEIWKDIKDYEGSYQCSSFGRVRSLDRYIEERSGKKQFRKGQIIKARLNKNGYLQLALNKNSKRKMKYVHILIAETFLENHEKLETVNHKDGNKLNNNVDNLEWSSYSDNNQHAYDELHRPATREGASPKPVYIIDTYNNNIIQFDSIRETVDNIGLSHTQINRYIHSDKKWKGRYIFETDSNKCVEDIEKVS